MEKALVASNRFVVLLSRGARVADLHVVNIVFDVFKHRIRNIFMTQTDDLLWL